MLPPHPDRTATTLATLPECRARAGDGPFAGPGPGSADARVPLKQALEAARLALQTRATPAARERFARIAGADLVAGTVRDGVARGLLVAAEETLSLCKPAPRSDEPEPDPLALVSQRELRKPREVLVASGGARVRWSRKAGFLFVERAEGAHAEDCVHFEDRGDAGTLDGFVAREGERPRLFSPAFLKPVRIEHGKERDLLALAGRLGRRGSGYACEITVEGRKREDFVRLRIAVQNSQADHRLRVRFGGALATRVAGLDDVLLGETVQHAHGTFLAATLVRACGILRVGAELVPVPDAQSLGTIVRTFRLGGA